ncbi:hypothetical protein [Thalassoglobus polymorphus]|uniref:Secreted protein n=1 Tax=Thalassoglobus polymorphus TaxID=2527994 RepID=A0A517QHV9_9PLAN|nr:hypothetical protein [Thalassoglobus polymorphus]QDT31226.1 hypothetical protein Mal48_04580 [Thalassoglobus polymorphus]
MMAPFFKHWLHCLALLLLLAGGLPANALLASLSQLPVRTGGTTEEETRHVETAEHIVRRVETRRQNRFAGRIESDPCLRNTRYSAKQTQIQYFRGHRLANGLCAPMLT